jgi:hypothetical protein
MRHAPFTIGPRERDAWLLHMRQAVESLDLSPEHEATLWSYLERAAFFMVNTLDPGPAASGLRSEATREGGALEAPGPRERSERQEPE